MNTLAKNDRGMSLSDVARETGLPVSTTHRLLSTLQREDFVRYEAERSIWTIGVQSFIVGNAFLRSRELTSIARPLMRELMEKSGETVNLAIEEHGEAIYIAQVECREMMRAITWPGGRAALHASGVGKVLLAAMSDEEIEKIITQHGLPKATEQTIVSPAKLHAEISRIRGCGYAIDEEENAIGLRCVASAIFDENGRPVAALSLSGPSVRVTPDLLPELGEAVKETAARITEGLGGLTATY